MNRSGSKTKNRFWFGKGRFFGIQTGSFPERCKDPYCSDLSLVQRFMQGRQQSRYGPAEARCLGKALTERINNRTAQPDLLILLSRRAAEKFIQDKRFASSRIVLDLSDLLKAVIVDLDGEAAIEPLMNALQFHLTTRLLGRGGVPTGEEAISGRFAQEATEKPIEIFDDDLYAICYLQKMRRPLIAAFKRKLRALARNHLDLERRKELLRSIRTMKDSLRVGDASLVRYHVKVLHHYSKCSGPPPQAEADQIREKLINRLRNGLLDDDVIPLLNRLTDMEINDASWEGSGHEIPDAVELYRELVNRADRPEALPYLLQAIDASLRIPDSRSFREDPVRVEGTRNEVVDTGPDQCGHINNTVEVYESHVVNRYFHVRLPMVELVGEKLETLQPTVDQETKDEIREALERIKSEIRNKNTIMREHRWEEHVRTFFDGDSGYW